MKRIKQVFLAAAALCCAVASAQQVPPLAYEVAVVKPNTTGSGNMWIHNHDNDFEASNVTLENLIMDCYTLQTPAQLIGMPAWAGSAHYDLSAKIDAETAARLQTLKGNARWEARKEMMRVLLAERFGFKVHAEKRELPIFKLVQVKGGARLKAAEPNALGRGNVNINNGKLTGTGLDMDRLAYFVSSQVQRKVVDKTGLMGIYDVALEWSRDEPTGSMDAAEKAPGFFTALQEQLGLKLEPGKGPIDTIVVDQIEKPSEN